MAGANGLDQYETIIFKDSVSRKAHLKDITDAEEKDDAMILYSLAKFLVIKNYKILISGEELHRELACASGIYANEEVDSYFRDVCGKLFQMMKEINMSDGLQVSISRSHSFVRFFDMNVNKAAYEVVTILGSACKYNVILFCVINLSHYTCERLLRPIDLKDAFFGNKYAGEQLHLFELHKALDSFVRNIEETFAFQRERSLLAQVLATFQMRFANRKR